MNSTKYKRFLMVLIFMVSLWLVPQAQAAVANNAAEFTIDPVYPSEQQADNTGYFSLAVHPASTVPVKVKITNTNQHQAITYRLKVGNATTNPDGSINYANFKAKKDPTAQYQLTDFIDHAKRGQKITVPANSDRTVTVNLRLPAHAFSGIVAGGVYVERLTNGANQQSGNFQTQTHFAMTLPILVTEHPHAKRIAKMQLAQVKVQKGQIAARLHNVRPVLFGKLTIHARITKAHQTKALVKKTVTNYQVAPNSAFDFVVTDPKRPLNAGHYTLTMSLQSGKRQWHFSRAFTVTASQAAPLTKRTGWLGLPLLLWLIGGGLVLIILALVGVILKQRKKLSQQ